MTDWMDEHRLCQVEGKINALTQTMERLEDIEYKAKQQEALLIFLVGYVLQGFADQHQDEKKMKACKKYIKKWYYGGHRSKRVTLYAEDD